jgi:hypothetical protein
VNNPGSNGSDPAKRSPHSPNPPSVRDDDLRGMLDSAQLRALIRTLPDFQDCKAGLCVDRAPVQSVRMEGKARLSVLRLYTKTGGKAKLVGQVQIVAHGPGRETWNVEYYAHDPAFGAIAHEISDRKAWWSAVLARHAQASGLTN